MKLKNTNITKKQSFAKIVISKLSDISDEFVDFLAAFVLFVFIIYPLFIESVPIIIALINAVVCIVVPVFYLIIRQIKALKRMQYLPLSVDEIESLAPDDFEDCINCINELLAVNTYSRDTSEYYYRAVVPETLSKQVIDSITSYYNLDDTEVTVVYDRVLKEFRYWGYKWSV